jgi:hypothetical protein
MDPAGWAPAGMAEKESAKVDAKAEERRMRRLMDKQVIPGFAFPAGVGYKRK